MTNRQYRQLANACDDPIVDCPTCDGEGHIERRTGYHFDACGDPVESADTQECPGCYGCGTPYFMEYVDRAEMDFDDAVAMAIDLNLLSVDEADALLTREVAA